MSTDEFSQDQEEMYLHRASSMSSSSYPNLGDMSNSTIQMSGQMKMQQNMPQMALSMSGQPPIRQKRKYTRRKQPEERKKRGPRAKDINAPRMPLNGYVRFLNANRDRVKQEHPELTFAEVTKRLASEWSSMSADDKKTYLDEAEKAKEAYLKELREYQQTESYQEFINMKHRAKKQQQQQQQQQQQSLLASPPINSRNRSQSSGVQIPLDNSQQQQHQQQQQCYQANASNSHENRFGMMYGIQSSSYSPGGYPVNGQRVQHPNSGAYLQRQQQYYGQGGNSSMEPLHQNQAQQRNNYQMASGNYPNNACNGVPCQQQFSTVDNNRINNYHEPSALHSGQNGGLISNGALSAVLDKCNPIIDLPIFTEEFLEHNKMRENELRNLRSLATQYEEENAILSKHIEDITSATEKLVHFEAKERETNNRLSAIFQKLQHTLVEKFANVRLSGSYLAGEETDLFESDQNMEPPDLNNLDRFIQGLSKLIQTVNDEKSVNVPTGMSELMHSIQTAISSMDEVSF